MTMKHGRVVFAGMLFIIACAMAVGLAAHNADSFGTDSKASAAVGPGSTSVADNSKTNTAAPAVTDNSGTNTQAPAAASAVPSDTPPTAEPTEEVGAVPFEGFVYDLPDGYETPTDRSGEIHEETYVTYLYDNEGNRGEKIEATLYVYTPVGYDPGRQYNIIYLMHGSGEVAGYWLGAGPYAEDGERYDSDDPMYTVNVLEHMIADGLCDGTIVVSPTFMDQFTDNDRFNGSSFDKLVRMSYQFRNDILPFVEGKYSTYAGGDVSDAGLIASRDHRAYAGLSLGSLIGFRAIWMNCVEYFSYIGNFSGCDDDDGSLAYMVAEALNTRYAGYDIKYWYNGNGTYDHLHDDHATGYAILLEQCPDKFTEGTDFANGQNCIFVDKPGKGHTYESWIVDFYNVMSIFFKAG